MTDDGLGYTSPRYAVAADNEQEAIEIASAYDAGDRARSPQVALSPDDIPAEVRASYDDVFAVQISVPHGQDRPTLTVGRWVTVRGRREVTGHVTPEDIKAGDGTSVTDTHPVALAVRRALNLGDRIPPYIGVGDAWFSINVQGSFWESHDLPPGSLEWIQKCHAGQPVEPFDFTFTTAWGAP